MIPYSRPKHPDLYTLSQSKLIENHTFHSGTYLYIPYMVVPPSRRVSYQNLKFQIIKVARLDFLGLIPPNFEH